MAFPLTTSMNEMIIVSLELSQRQEVLYSALNTCNCTICTRSTIAKRIKMSHLSSLQVYSINQVKFNSIAAKVIIIEFKNSIR